MKEPTPENLERYVQTIRDYEAAIEAYYSYDAVADEEGAAILFAAAQASLINMRVAWKVLSGFDATDVCVGMVDSTDARKLLNTYIDEPDGKLDDFIHRLKGEPVSLSGLMDDLKNEDKKVTPKLLADIYYRMHEYCGKLDSCPISPDNPGSMEMAEGVYEEMGIDMAIRQVFGNALWLLQPGNEKIDKQG